MTPLTIWVRATELRVGDLARIDGVAGEVRQIREVQGKYLYVICGPCSYLIEPDRQVEINLEDDGR
jgi:hypothetical protein